MGQPNCSAMAHPGSVLYTMPTAGGQVSAALLPMWGLFSNAHPPNYNPVPITSPPNYNPVPITPPPTYDQVTAALLPNSPVPSAPPPEYEVIMNIFE